MCVGLMQCSSVCLSLRGELRLRLAADAEESAEDKDPSLTSVVKV